MRIKLKLKADNLLLPLSYRHGIQGMIYSNLDDELASQIHDLDNYKFFTFSKILGKYDILPANQINFNGFIYIVIASINPIFLENLYTNLSNRGYIILYGKQVSISSIEVYGNNIDDRIITYRTLSPVTSYISDDYGNVTFLKPFMSEYEYYLLLSLNRKLEAMNISYDNDFKILKFEKIKRGIFAYKNCSYEAYDYIVSIEASELLHNLIMDSGLGSKNSIGFGMVELY